jgi:hypothetical protein
MHGELICTEENLAEHPKTVQLDPTDEALAIGDLHGNAMKAIYFLICYGVMTLEDPADYATLWRLYNTSTEQLTRNHLNQFKLILDNASIKSPKLLTLIGDELADRGNNDCFTLLVMKKLHDSKVPYQTLLSNHGCLALESFSKQSAIIPIRLGRYQPTSTGSPIVVNQQISLDNLWKLVNQQEITIDEMTALYKDHQSHIRLIGYTKTIDGNLTLYTHAPVGLETVAGIAKQFKVKYDDSTVDTLIACIDEINAKAVKAIQENTFHSYWDFVTQNRKDEQRSLFNLMWNRVTLDFRLKPKGQFNVEVVHGHIGEGSAIPGAFSNIDSFFGQTIDQDTQGHKGKLIVYKTIPDLEYLITKIITECKTYLEHLPKQSEKRMIITDAVRLLGKKKFTEFTEFTEFFDFMLKNQIILEKRRNYWLDLLLNTTSQPTHGQQLLATINEYKNKFNVIRGTEKKAEGLNTNFSPNIKK